MATNVPKNAPTADGIINQLLATYFFTATAPKTNNSTTHAAPAKDFPSCTDCTY